MREIKFRVFDWYKMQYLDTQDNEIFIWFDWLCYKVDSWIESYEIKQLKDIILMQYTWLKDKDWKEIYEWDILECYDSWKPYRCIIEWKDELASCWCCFESFDWSWFAWTVIWNEHHSSSLATSIDKSKIIWNIYENKDLLTN